MTYNRFTRTRTAESHRDQTCSGCTAGAKPPGESECDTRASRGGPFLRRMPSPERRPSPVAVPGPHTAPEESGLHGGPRVAVDGENGPYLRLVHVHHGVGRDHLGSDRNGHGGGGRRWHRRTLTQKVKIIHFSNIYLVPKSFFFFSAYAPALDVHEVCVQAEQGAEPRLGFLQNAGQENAAGGQPQKGSFRFPKCAAPFSCGRDCFRAGGFRDETSLRFEQRHLGSSTCVCLPLGSPRRLCEVERERSGTRTGGRIE